MISFFLGFIIYLVGYVLAASITAQAAPSCLTKTLNNSAIPPANATAKAACYAGIVLPLGLM